MRRSIVAAVLTAAICVPVANAEPVAKSHKQVWTYPGRISLRAARGKNVADKPPPPAPEPTVVSAYEAPAPPVPVTSTVPTTSGGCPASMAGEASSPDAVNPTSGAAGCYQVLPSTAAAMGPACADVNAQSCVDAICASQGNSAWSASGATPCG